MRADDCQQAADLWFQVHGAEVDYTRLRYALRTLLPDELVGFAAGRRLFPDGREPATCIVAATDALFLALHLNADGSTFVAAATPLSTDHISMSVEARPYEQDPTGRDANMRGWSFSLKDGTRIELMGVVELLNRSPSGPDRAELLGRHLAARHGWTLPEG
jgi:hypothetical protein